MSNGSGGQRRPGQVSRLNVIQFKVCAQLPAVITHQVNSIKSGGVSSSKKSPILASILHSRNLEKAITILFLRLKFEFEFESNHASVKSTHTSVEACELVLKQEQELAGGRVVGKRWMWPAVRIGWLSRCGGCRSRRVGDRREWGEGQN